MTLGTRVGAVEGPAVGTELVRTVVGNLEGSKEGLSVGTVVGTSIIGSRVV